jgi:NADPH:quinone reductase-like Zn-dependent oxidoreductase
MESENAGGLPAYPRLRSGGLVEAVGEGAGKFAVGEEVYGQPKIVPLGSAEGK